METLSVGTLDIRIHRTASGWGIQAAQTETKAVQRIEKSYNFVYTLRKNLTKKSGAI